MRVSTCIALCVISFYGGWIMQPEPLPPVRDVENIYLPVTPLPIHNHAREIKFLAAAVPASALARPQ